MYPYKSSHDVIGKGEHKQCDSIRVSKRCFREGGRQTEIDNTNEITMLVTMIHAEYKKHEYTQEEWENTRKQLIKMWVNKRRAKLTTLLNTIGTSTETKQTKCSKRTCVRGIESYEQNKKSTRNMAIYKGTAKTGGGLYFEQEENTYALKNLNMSEIWEERESQDDDYPVSIKEEDEYEWDFIQKLPSSIRADQDNNGNILFRRFGYGLLISKEELLKCVNLIQENETTEVIYQEIELQALYQYKSSDSESTEGMGFCATLALVGTLNPQLNSVEAMNNMEGRNAIADVLEEILIPSVREYKQPSNYALNPKAHEHDIYKDHTIEHLTTNASILRSTSDKHVGQDQWMYVSDVGIIVQSMPVEVAYWQEIGSNRWVALNLWSSVTTESKRQTIRTLQDIIKPNTSHVAYAKSHFFNTKEVRPNRYKNILIEIINAVILTQEQTEKKTVAIKEKNNMIQPEELDEGSIATQKKGAQWFMSISKKKARELGKLLPSQIKDALVNSKTVIQINKSIKNVNWTLVNADNFCGYQSLHAVAMHSEGKNYQEITQNIQTKDKPYRLIAFLQKQTVKLQGSNMTNALKRVNEAIQSLNRSETITRQSWCPTELIDHILPTIHPNSNFWNHSRPPTGQEDWLTTYYNREWLQHETGLDVIFNGVDHFTIHLNTGIKNKEILEGIDNLVDVIVNRSGQRKGWYTVKGELITRMTRVPETIQLEDSEEEEYREVISKRARRGKSMRSESKHNGHAVTTCATNERYIRRNNNDLETPTPGYLRSGCQKSYEPEYDPLDDAIPTMQIQEIPFPKKHRNDPTSIGEQLVTAPSRIGSGLGVYTLIRIPAGKIIMNYIDELGEVIMQEDICGGNRDTTYMYANHKTNTYINASNNKYSYCGQVNEALEDKNFNTIICESRDSRGHKWVYYKTTREINAKEELGTRYSIDGSYWDNSKTYFTEFLNKVQECYHRTIPFQSTKQSEINDSQTKSDLQNPKKNKENLEKLIRIYNTTNKESERQYKSTPEYYNKPYSPIEENSIQYDTPEGTTNKMYINENENSKQQNITEPHSEYKGGISMERSIFDTDESDEERHSEGDYTTLKSI